MGVEWGAWPLASRLVNLAGRLQQAFLFCENSTKGNEGQTEVPGISLVPLITVGPRGCAPHGQARRGDFVGMGVPGNSGVLSPGPCRVGTLAQDGLISF